MSGIDFIPFREGSIVPNVCGECHGEMTEWGNTAGVYHRVSGVAEKRFDGLHIACLEKSLEKDGSCPLCHERVSRINGESLELREARLKFEEALATAIREKNKENLIDLLKDHPAQGVALITAAENGLTDFVRASLIKYRFDVYTIEKAVQQAASNGHDEIIHLLLDGCPISEEINLRNAVTGAVTHGHAHTAKMLLDDYKVALSSKDRDFAFQMATLNGHMDGVRLMLTPTTSYQHLIGGFVTAAVNGHFKVAAHMATSLCSRGPTQVAIAVSGVALALLASASYYTTEG